MFLAAIMAANNNFVLLFLKKEIAAVLIGEKK